MFSAGLDGTGAVCYNVFNIAALWCAFTMRKGEGRMSEPRRDEKNQDEKSEKGRDDSWDEKWRRDPVEAAVWAFVLIWAGIVWLLSNTGTKAAACSTSPHSRLGISVDYAVYNWHHHHQ